MLLTSTIISFVLSAIFASIALTTESAWAYHAAIVSLVALNICVLSYVFRARKMYFDAKAATAARRTL
jgi:hypothetical protein